MARVLVIEDDPGAAAEIAAALTDSGYSVTSAHTGREGLMLAASQGFDAVVLDRMLPGGLDGLGVLATLRATGSKMPVLILSALSGVNERVHGLKTGADDYLTKPFECLELTARLNALIRRRPRRDMDPVLRAGDLELNTSTHAATRAGRKLELQPREFRLLEYLMRHAGQVVTRTMIFEEVWHYTHDRQSNIIDVHVSNLRRKVDGEGMAPLIHTVRGSGYTLRPAG